MKKPKRKQHVVFSALEGLTEVPQPRLPSPGAVPPRESHPMPETAEVTVHPEPFAQEQRRETVLSPLIDPGAPAADATPPASPAPAIEGAEPFAEEPPPQFSSTLLTEPDALLPDELPPVSPAPGILGSNRAAEQALPQIFSNVATVPDAPAADSTPLASPPSAIPVTEPRAEEPASGAVSTPSIRSGVRPHLSFIHILPGTFFMGSPENESGRASDEVLHQVTLTKGFAIQTTPVTQALWRSVMVSNPSEFILDGFDRPVENVSWEDCQEFIQRLNRMGDDHYRLPSEAEWEYACRAGTSTACAGGKLIELQGGVDPVLDAFGWYCGNSGGTTHAVAHKQPNAWELYDLHGNVMEWCRDGYAPYGDIRMHKIQGEWVTTTNERIDPVNLPEGKTKVVRGGAWVSAARQCRSAARLAWPAEGKNNFIGFRLVRE